MSSTKPLISVGMPVYNGGPYIAQAIQSVLDQSDGNFELVISDNASTDNTEKICREFAKNDNRIVYMRNKTNIGAAKNYNNVFKHTKAPYFRWHNADDLCDRRSHELCLSVLMKKPDTVLCYGKTQTIDGKGKIIEPYDDNLNLQQNKASERFKAFLKQVGLTNVIYGLMRRSAVEKTQLMGNGSYYASDINFMAEMTLHGKFYELPETLFYRRMHESCSSWDRKDDTVQLTFWKGKNESFRLPTLKKYLAYLKAIYSSPNNLLEKFEMQRTILRRMIWMRRDIVAEILSDIRNGKLI
jgi:glycosyltransferase involved in cell wall biosynthesis